MDDFGNRTLRNIRQFSTIFLQRAKKSERRREARQDFVERRRIFSGMEKFSWTAGRLKEEH